MRKWPKYAILRLRTSLIWYPATLLLYDCACTCVNRRRLSVTGCTRDDIATPVLVVDAHCAVGSEPHPSPPAPLHGDDTVRRPPGRLPLDGTERRAAPRQRRRHRTAAEPERAVGTTQWDAELAGELDQSGSVAEPHLADRPALLARSAQSAHAQPQPQRVGDGVRGAAARSVPRHRLAARADGGGVRAPRRRVPDADPAGARRLVGSALAVGADEPRRAGRLRRLSPPARARLLRRPAGGRHAAHARRRTRVRHRGGRLPEHRRAGDRRRRRVLRLRPSARRQSHLQRWPSAWADGAGARTDGQHERDDGGAGRDRTRQRLFALLLGELLWRRVLAPSAAAQPARQPTLHGGGQEALVLAQPGRPRVQVSWIYFILRSVLYLQSCRTINFFSCD